MTKYKFLTYLFVIFLMTTMSVTRISAQSSCPVFIPKAASFVSANKAATVGNMSYVLDGEGTTGLPSNGQGNVVYWLQSANPVTFYFDMKASSTISRVKFYQPWGFDEGAQHVTVRLYNGATLLGTEAIVLPSLYPAGYIAILSKTYTDVTKIQMVIVDDYNISGATPKRTSLREVVFGDTACTDTDGDTVVDYLDFDNDNDGIKDIDENCSGFLAQNTSGAWKGKTTSTLTATLTGATAQSTIYHAFSDEQIKYYVNQNGGDPRYYKAGTASFTYTFSTPVPANEIAFFVDDVDPSNGSTNASINFKINGGDPNGNFVIANYSTNTATYLNYNPITGVMSTSSGLDDQRLIIKGVGDILVSSITITNSGIPTSDGVAYALLANHPCDTDGDGTPNYLDLDSDGDGCVDAIEGAGSFTSSQLTAASGTINAQSPNQNFGITVDANGIPTTVGATGQGVGESQDLTKNDCIDTDGDGVPDWKDLDNDNDGILDSDEGFSCLGIIDNQVAWRYNKTPQDRTPSVTAGSSYVASATNQTDGPGLTSVLNPYPTSSMQINNSYVNQPNLAGAKANGDYIQMSFTTSSFPANTTTYISGNEIWAEVDSTTPSANPNASQMFPYQFSMEISTDASFASNVSSVVKDATALYIGGVRGYEKFIGNDIKLSPNTTYYIRYYIYNATTSSGILIFDDQTPLFKRCNTLDTDGDGIPNYLDLDSDNDGCPDAIEGGASFTTSDLVNSTMSGGNSGATSGTYNQPVTQNLGNTVGNTATTMGVPSIAGTGQTIGDSQNFAANSQCTASFCYKPATTTGTALETHHGITALGRAGADNSNWPMVRKGAWTALEAKTKGFVVNRLTDAQIALISSANLVEGMMVYNITQDCLQINVDGTATGWKCFNTQACPD